MMTHKLLAHLTAAIRHGTFGACLVLGMASASAQGAASAPAASDLPAQATSALAWANELSLDASQSIERWLAAGSVNEDRLFDRLYFPIEGTSPPKFTTTYDALAERDFPAFQDKVLARSNLVVFAIVTDVNGYVPTHNARFSQPLTGNAAIDVVNHRTKRLLTEPSAFHAGRSEAPYLLQHYRFGGDHLAEVSVPVRVRGRHFGCVRVAYRVEK
jgi:hypothetical protein